MTWLRDMLERAAVTFAEGALSVLLGGALDIWHMDLKTALGVGAGAALISLLKSVAARKVGDPNSASLAN